MDSSANPSILICRGCLTEWAEMKNMYEWGLDVDFFRYTDISREPSEGLPVLLCSECEADLKKTKDFVERCHQSNRILKHNLKMVSNGEGNINKSNVSSLFLENQLVLMITAPDPDNKINLPCPFDNCDVTFIKITHLSKHLKNTHNLPENFDIEQQYYCTEEGCVYNLNSTPNKHFSGRKFLNQHYNKTHKDKIYFCDKCNLKFSIETDLNRHLKTCNMIYTCPICKKEYKNNETYLVHLKRRHPSIHAKYKLDKKTEKLINDIDKSHSKEINKISLKRKICDNHDTDDQIIKITDLKKALEYRHNVKDGFKLLENQKSLTVQKPDFDCLIENLQVIDNNTQPDSRRLTNIKDKTVNIEMVVTDEVIAEKYIHEKSVRDECKTESNKQKTVIEVKNAELNDEQINAHKTEVQSSTNFVEECIVTDCTENIFSILKKSSATQIPETVPSDETLNSWTNKTDFEMQTDGISTQTVLDEILSFKPQNPEDEVFFSESVSDIETQTFPFEFPLSRCNKETQFSTSITPDFSYKETQTCVCFCPASRPNCRHIGCLISSQNCDNVISTETQTVDSRKLINSDVMLSFSSTETQTCFDSTNDSM